MNKKSHLIITEKIADNIPERDRAWLMFGSILPDLLVHTFLKRHIWKNSFKSISKKIYRLEKKGKKNRFSYLMLGYVLHYVEDFYTFAHNTVFGGSLRAHVLYERRLAEYLQEEYVFSDKVNVELMSLPATMEYLKTSHDEYLKNAGDINTDIRYICEAARVVYNCLLRAFEVNSRKAETMESVPVYTYLDAWKVRF